MNRAEREIAEIWRRVLSGEPPDEVLADLERRDAERRAWFAAERARLQAEVDACTVRMLACQGAAAMNDDLAELVRQAVRAEVEPLRRALERLAGHALTPQQRATVEALAAVFGTAPFTTAEAVGACALPIGARPALRAALLALGGTLTAQRVGIALGRIVELGGEAGAVRLTAPRNERGRRLWCIDRRTGWG